MSEEEVRQFNKLVQFAEERMKLKVKILIKWEMHLIFCFSAFRFPFLINDSTINSKSIATLLKCMVEKSQWPTSMWSKVQKSEDYAEDPGLSSHSGEVKILKSRNCHVTF